MRLYGNEIALDALATDISLEKSRGEAAATLSVTLLKAAADRYVKKESLAVGDTLRLCDEDGSAVFAGAIEEIARTGEQVKLIACDAGLYLTKNEVCGVFAGSAEAICRAIAGKIALPVGRIDAPQGYKSFVARANVSAFSLLRQAVGEEREISVRDGSLIIERSGERVHTIAPESVLYGSGTASVTQMVNGCIVLGRGGAVAAAAQNAADIARYGQRQEILTQSGDASAQANAALCGMKRRGTLTLKGDLGLRCGDKIALARPEWGIDGTYPVVAVKHAWKRGGFTSEVSWEQ